MSDNLDDFIERVVDLIEPVVSADFLSEVLEGFTYWSEILGLSRHDEFTPTITPADITTEQLRTCQGDACKLTLSLMAVDDHGQTVQAYAFTLDLEVEQIIDDKSGDVWL